MVHLTGPELYAIELKGESHYQTALRSICSRDREKIVIATLVYEDDNPHDDKAIRVDVKGKTVGYLSRENARQYRERLAEAGYPGYTATCFAEIGKGKPGYGVRLDLPTGKETEDRWRVIEELKEQLAWTPEQRGERARKHRERWRLTPEKHEKLVQVSQELEQLQRTGQDEKRVRELRAEIASLYTSVHTERLWACDACDLSFVVKGTRLRCPQCHRRMSAGETDEIIITL